MSQVAACAWPQRALGASELAVESTQVVSSGSVSPQEPVSSSASLSACKRRSPNAIAAATTLSLLLTALW